MALKWWETTSIVGQQSTVTRQKAKSLLDQLSQRQAQRREAEEAEARRKEELSVRWRIDANEARKRARAHDDINATNKVLQGLGMNLLNMSEANISTQIRSGYSWTQDLAEQAKRDNWGNILNDVRKEATDWAKWRVREKEGNWADYSPEQQKQYIDNETQSLLLERYPGEEIPGYGVVEDTRLGGQIPREGLEIAEGIKVMPDYSVYSGNSTEPIGKINPETGEFEEMEPRWWEKAGNILKWLPPIIPVTLIQKYGPAISEKVDLPFMIQSQAHMLSGKDELNEAEQAFMDLYKQEVGEPPEISLLEKALHPAIYPAKLWRGAELSPSEKLKEVYYESTGVGTRILQGITTPTMIALFVAGGLGGATAAQPRLAATAARGGVRGGVAQAAQMVTAPIVGYEWVAGKVIAATVGGAYRTVMTSVLRRNLHSWAKGAGVQIPKATEDAFIKTALANLEPQFMAKEAVKTLFKPIKGGHTITQAGAAAAEQAAAQAVKTSPLLLGLGGKLTTPAVVPPSAGVIPKSVTVVAPVTPKVTTVTKGVTPEGISMPAAVQQEFLVRAETWLQQVPEVKPNSLHTVGVAEGEAFIRTDSAGNSLIAGISLMREGQLTLSTIVATPGKEMAVGRALVDVGEYIKANNVVFPPRAEMSPEAIRIYDKLVARGEVPEYAMTQAMAEWETTTAPIEGVEVTVEGLSSSKLRQSIMAHGKGRGLSQTKLNEIFKDVVGKSETGGQLAFRLTEMTDIQLQDTLEIIRSARPVRIGAKRVIRPSTEKKIQSLKESLIREGKLTDEAFDSMVDQLRLPAVGYESAQKFITEKEGNSLIRLMNDEAEIGLIARQAEVVKALEGNPAIKTVYDDYSNRLVKAGQVYFEGKPAGASMLKDQRFVMEDLQIRTGKEFYDVYFDLNRAKNANRAYFEEVKKRLIASTPQYNKLVNDLKGMKRVRDYIAAKNAWAKVKSPENITPDEIKLANAYEKELLDLQPDFRYHRFVHQYHANNGDVARMKEHIPDASTEQLRKAANIYEGKGGRALRTHLNTQTWGIIGSGYEPHYVVSPQLAMRKLKAAFATRRLEPRTGVEFYPEDITIDKAVERYVRQIRSYNLKPYARKMERLYAESLTQLKNPRQVNRGLSTMLNEMLGYQDRTFFGELVMKVASQAYITVFGSFPSLPFRNLFQNLAHFPDKPALVDVRNRKLTDWERKFYEVHVSQMKGIRKDLLLAEEAGLPGFRRINRFVLRLNLYGASDDKVNRIWSYWAALNKADRALTQFNKDGNVKKFVSGSGMAGMTLTQQKQVLENLAMDKVAVPGVGPMQGGKVAITEIANEITNNVHFLYDRSQRAWIEMGEMGRIVGSLVVFPRSVVQRALIQAQTLDPKSTAPPEKKRRAAKIIFALLWGSFAANYLFQKATGREDTPYNPINMLKWSPGGLSLGALTNLTEVSGLLVMAMSGSEWAQGQLPSAVTQSSDTFVPYYKLAMQVIESAFEKKHIDRQLYRELRSIFEKQMQEMGFLDDAYEPNASFYEAERSGIWKLKHALFGTEPEEETTGDTTLKVQRDILSQFEYSKDWKDLNEVERTALLGKYPDLAE